jgi:hypothetical protein
MTDMSDAIKGLREAVERWRQQAKERYQPDMNRRARRIEADVQVLDRCASELEALLAALEDGVIVPGELLQRIHDEYQCLSNQDEQSIAVLRDLEAMLQAKEEV